MCSKPYPQYKELYSTMKKITCSEKCRRKLAALKLSEYKEDQKYQADRRRINRSTYCMRKTTVCKHYDNWLIYPAFLCECVGYSPVPKPMININLQSALGGSRVSNGQVARKRGCE